MASSVVFKPNYAGIGELLRSGAMQADVQRRANAVAAAAGPGHDVLNTSTNWARATVATDTREAAVAEATSHTLTKAMSAAGG
jgi:hypothetical protein